MQPLPRSVGCPGCGARTPPCSWAGTVLLWILSWESKGAKHPEHSSTQGLGGQWGVWDPPPVQQPWGFGDSGLRLYGVRVGEWGPQPISVLPELVFSVKLSLCSQSPL